MQNRPTQLFINNQFVASTTGKTFAVDNPATQQEIAQVSDASLEDAEAAIAAASKAFGQHRLVASAERSQWLLAWAKGMESHKEALAQLITAESGKPITEARGEVDYSLGYLHWFAGECLRQQGQQLPQLSSDKWMFTRLEPIGVCATITPWNFPLAMAMRKWAPALAAGNAVVAKPATETPLTALAAAQLYAAAGLPEGLLQVLPTSNYAALGKLLCEHPQIGKLSFTGSTATGRLLMQQSSSTLKRLSMELGGNAPAIVYADADLDLAVAGLMKAKFRNGGQSCVAANRIYVHERLHDAFVERLQTAIHNLVQTDPMNEACQIGTVIHAKAVQKVDALVLDALGKGAECLAGGGLQQEGQLFYQPSLLVNCQRNMDLHNTEIFGPVAAIYRFSEEEEVLAWANDSPYGLVAYLFAENMRRIQWFQQRLQVGMLGVNTGLISHAEVPFGGVKQSGFGREGGYVGLADYQQMKYVAMC